MAGPEAVYFTTSTRFSEDTHSEILQATLENFYYKILYPSHFIDKPFHCGYYGCG